MDVADIVFLIITLCGAVLAAFLATRLLRRNRRQLLLVFEIAGLTRTGHLSITNFDHRPTTITEIHIIPKMQYRRKGQGLITGFDLIPESNPQIPPRNRLPVSLVQGESVKFVLPKTLTEIMDQGSWPVNLAVKDLDGNTYKRYYCINVW
jgi:hypothetical protein